MSKETERSLRKIQMNLDIFEELIHEVNDAFSEACKVRITKAIEEINLSFYHTKRAAIKEALTPNKNSEQTDEYDL